MPGKLHRKFWGATGEPPALVYSKLKLTVALKQLGLWERVVAWMEANDYTDYWRATQNLRADNPLFEQGRDAVVNLLGLDAEQVDAILAECIAEED